jgi:hypothetical protein
VDGLPIINVCKGWGINKKSMSRLMSGLQTRYT